MYILVEYALRTYLNGCGGLELFFDAGWTREFHMKIINYISCQDTLIRILSLS